VASRETKREASVSAPTILVVDDNQVTLKMVRVALEAEGYTAVTG
jgi:CheY-like chemotaxis protein